MIHTIKIDDSTPTGKKLVNELRRHTKTVHFEISSTDNIPKGYMTSDEFWKKSRENVDILCKKHGLI